MFSAFRILSERFSAVAFPGLDFIALVPTGTGVVSFPVWNTRLAVDNSLRAAMPLPGDSGGSAGAIPTWDGHPKGWRRYQREVAWFVQGTKHNQRRYLATRLIGRLSGAARLLAMSWPQQEFDEEQGVLTYMRKLAGSPLVRRSLPNAAAIMAQYFGFKRHPGEQITTFLVRETLGFEEFQEALLRLKDEKHGLTATRQFFGLEGLLTKPDEDTRDREADSSWWRRGWGRDDDNGWPHDDDADDPQDAGEQAAAMSAAEAQATQVPGERTPGSVRGPPGTPGSRGPPETLGGEGDTPQRMDRGTGPGSQSGRSPTTPVPETLTDNFILDVLRGWRLLQAASLTLEERRDVLSSTGNRLDFESVSQALQIMWDEQLAGVRKASHPNSGYGPQVFSLEAGDWGRSSDHGWSGEDEASDYYYHEHEDGWHGYDALFSDSGWWDDELYPVEEMDNELTNEEAEDEKIREAMQAEKAAEALATEASLTWKKAQKATADMRRDRGFGAVRKRMSKGKGPACYKCGRSGHFARDCPLGASKGSYMIEDDWSWYQGGLDSFAFLKGKNKGKGKGKNHFGTFKGYPKGKGPQGSRFSFPGVNAYGLEMLGTQSGQLDDAPTRGSTLPPGTGLLDCGATASAGPEASVQRLITAVLEKDKSAIVSIDQARRPYFRYGSGSWGRALYHVVIKSNVSGSLKAFEVYALPNPPEYFEKWFSEDMLVPILVGMSHIGRSGAGMIVDFSDGYFVNANDPNLLDKPQYLSRNDKGHFVLDVVDYLTAGQNRAEGSCQLHVACAHGERDLPSTDQDVPLKLMYPLELCGMSSESSVARASVHQRRALMQQLVDRRHLLNDPEHFGSRMVASTPTSPHVNNSFAQHNGSQEEHRSSPASGRESGNSARPKRCSFNEDDLAMLRTTCRSESGQQPPRPVDGVRNVCSEVAVHPPSGLTRIGHEVRERGDSPQGDEGLARGSGKPASHLRVGEGGHRGGVCEEQVRAAPTCQGLQGEVARGDGARDPHSGGQGSAMDNRGDGPGVDEQPQRGGDGRRGDLKTTRGDKQSVNDQLEHRGTTHGRVSMRGQKHEAPWKVCQALLTMASIMVTKDRKNASDLLVGDCQKVVWEIGGTVESTLATACEKAGLPTQRIGHFNEYDLYKQATYPKLQEMFRVQQPRILWFSPRGFCWSPEENLHDGSWEGHQRGNERQHKERTMLYRMSKFLLWCLEVSPGTHIYWEWPPDSLGWKDRSARQFEESIKALGKEWLRCRLDGCRYGLELPTAGSERQFLQEKWLVKTTCPVFHSLFKTKVCVQPHQHAPANHIARNARVEYPLRMVEAFARCWNDLLYPPDLSKRLHRKLDVNTSEMTFAAALLPEAPPKWRDLEAWTKELRERQDFKFATFEQVALELQRAGVLKAAAHQRWKSSTTSSVLFGGYSHGGFSGVSKWSSKLPQTVLYLNMYLQHYLPGVPWTSLALTINGFAVPHRDQHNLGGTPNVLHCVGKFVGGGLWLEGYPEKNTEHVLCRRKLRDGSFHLGHICETKNKFVVFSPKQLHATQEWHGCRVGISAYTTRTVSTMEPTDLKLLDSLGFPFRESYDMQTLEESGHVTKEKDQVNAVEALDLLPVEEGDEFHDEPPEDPSQVEAPPLSETAVPTDRELKAWRRRVRHFHVAAGHPSNRNLARMLKDAGKPRWQVQEALDYECPECTSLKPGGSSSKQVPPISTRPAPTAWTQVVADVGEWTSVPHKCKLKFVLFVDAATHFRVAEPLTRMPISEMRQETAAQLIEVFSRRWLSDKPKPQVFIPDNGTSFVARSFQDFCSSVNIWMAPPISEESWAHGLAESCIQDVKEVMSKLQLSDPTLHPETCLFLATGALNQTEYVRGYSSYQWVYGKNFSLSDEDEVTLAQLKDDSPNAEFSKLVAKRQEAEETARSTRASRVLSRLKNSISRQPLRTFQVADLVKVWRRMVPQELHKGKRGGFKKAGRPSWIGPGRVVLHELLPHQDGDEAARHIVWVVLGGRLFRCSPHSVRPVTEMERAWHYATSGEEPHKWQTLRDIIPTREYEDLAEELPPGECDGDLDPDLPEEPSQETWAPVRRLRGKQTKVDPYAKQVATEEDVNDYQAPANNPQPEGLTETTGTSEPRGLHDLPRERPNPVEEPDAKRYRESSLDSEEALFAQLHETEEEIFHINVDLSFDSNREKKRFLHSPAAFLVAKMRDSEVRLEKLRPEERALFTRAKTKEVTSFLQQEAVRKCKDLEEERYGRESGRLMKCRWVLTWKPIPEEEREEALQDAKNVSTTTTTKDGKKKAKARIVLLGYQHPDLLKAGFSSSAPVQSLLTRCMSYQLAMQNGWELEGLDLSTAFLQTGKKEEMEIWTTGVPELRAALDIDDGGIMRVLKDFYGSTTAPRGLWQDLGKSFESVGGQRLISDPCLWIWTEPVKNPKNAYDTHRTIGFMGGHVDDFHRSGDLESPTWCHVRDQIDRLYKWGSTKRNNYRHAGTDLEMKTASNGERYLEVHQDAYVETLQDLALARDKSRSEKSELTKPEISQCRGALGGVQWLAVQTQPQLCARCNLLVSDLASAPTIKVAKEIQELISEVRAQPTRLQFRRLPGVKHWQDVRVITLGDQAHNNRARGGSTGGIITFLGGPNHDAGEPGPLVMLSWKSWKLQRVAIGTTDAEVQAMVESEDANYRARFLWGELNGAQINRHEDYLQQADDLVSNIPGIVGTDSKGGYDAITREEGANRRSVKCQSSHSRTSAEAKYCPCWL